MSPAASLVRYGEIGLKGGNRHDFIARLARNLRHALEPFPGCKVAELQGRYLVHHPEHGSTAVEALARVFGVTSVSPATRIDASAESLDAGAVAAAEAALAARPVATFRVTTNRANKRYPLRSIEVDRRAGAAVLARFPQLKVNLEAPELTIGIELRDEGVFVYHQRLPGPGGLPVGSLGRALGLLSGGIDSPVAAWLAMKRGLVVNGVFFHSDEFTGLAATGKVKKLARVLSRYVPNFVLHLVPFAPVQVAIRDHADPPYRTLLYRRMMHRIAVALARQERLQALVTGDNLGQVASQTLENLALTAAASELPVLRPLLTYDKEETVTVAKRLGTYEISIEPALDCCTLFQPARPRIRGDAADLERDERKLDLDALITQALAGRETWLFHHGGEGRQVEPRLPVAGNPTAAPNAS